VDWTNAQRGINGHPIQLIADREPNNPGVALSDVKKRVHQGIVALVEDDTNDGNAWISYIDKTGIPVLSATSPSLTVVGSKLDFSTNTSLLFTPQYTVQAAAKVGAPKMAAFYCGEIPTGAESVPALHAAGSEGAQPLARSRDWARFL
jgi:branched-chain amino acid transport system substrate-binding protein